MPRRPAYCHKFLSTKTLRQFRPTENWLCFFKSYPFNLFRVSCFVLRISGRRPVLGSFFQIPFRNTQNAVLGTPYGVLSTNKLALFFQIMLFPKKHALSVVEGSLNHEFTRINTVVIATNAPSHIGSEILMSLRGPKGRGNLLHHWQKASIPFEIGFELALFSRHPKP